MKLDAIKNFAGGGLDKDSSPETVAPNDYLHAENIRLTGTGDNEAGLITNIEGNELLTGTLLAGLNNVIGGGKFDDTGQILAFRYNSAGNNQIILYDYATNSYKVVFTDKTDSAGNALLPLDPQKTVLATLINNTYAVWWAQDLEVGYTNLNTLAAGGYGTVLWEDLSLIKPQCMIPPTGTYGSDLGQPANYLFGKLPQFTVQWVNADYNFSAWSTRSKRIVPYQQNTPIGGADVTKNNYIIVSVNIGSIRITTINIGARFGNDIFSIIKSVDRSYVTALTNASVDVTNQIREAYDPSTNLYSFAYYNDDISIPIPATDTDLAFDYVWPSNAGEKINGNILALGDWKVLYNRPSTEIAISAIGYNPNIDIPIATNPNPLRNEGSFPGGVGSGAGGHRRKMSITLGGIPHTGDNIITIMYDVRNANNTQYHNYIVPGAQDGDLAAVAASTATILPSSSYVDNGNGTFTINFIGDPYFELQTFSIQLFHAGATVANSVPAYLDNTGYQAALAYFDKQGRYFPLETNNTFVFNTPSYAQVNGQAIQVAWRLLNPLATAPVGAVGYQWLTTKPAVTNVIDTLATPLTYKGGWSAYANSPTLAVNSTTASVGDTYQVTSPAFPNDTAHYTNLGSGTAYDTGQYVTYNGQSWDVLPKTFGDLTTTGNIIAFSLNPLKMFNDQYAAVGVSTILGYDFSVGDRCTLHYYIDGSGNKVFINSPCVDLSVIGYDSATNIVKVEKSSTFNIHTNTDGKNVFLRLYSPALQDQTASAVQNTTVWYETGDRYSITNGLHDTVSGILYDGGVYYKTRQFTDALKPYANSPVETLATDLNYSDFYPSAFSSFGRVRAYNDILEKTEQKASIITSQPYVTGSKKNGLTRFYLANIYGDSDGQISSSKGGIQIMWQRGQVLLAIQQYGTFYIPVNEAYVVLNEQITGQSISEKLLNNGRYDPENIGLGNTKCFTTRYSTGYGVDPNKSLPYRWTIGGIEPIAGKMSQYLKATLQLAYSQGKKIIMFYNDFYEEVVMAIQADGGVLYLFPFTDGIWMPVNNYVIIGSQVSATPNGAHCTASYNSSTGVVTYTPTTNYVGNDVATFIFNPGTGNITLNNCLNWTAGDTDINPFSFTPLIDKLVSTLYYSNIVSIDGINVAVAISITGGEYAKNGGAFTSSPGTVVNGDTVQLRQTSSASFSTTTTATLTVSGFSADFKVTTASSGPPPGSSTLDVNNLSTDFTITFVHLRDGGTDYDVIGVGPGGHVEDVIDDDTYNVFVKILAGTPGAGATCYINGTPYTIPDSGSSFNQTGVTCPIIVELQEP